MYYSYVQVLSVGTYVIVYFFDMKFSFFGTILIVIYGFLSTGQVHGANILVYSVPPVRSHFKPYERLFLTLAKRGHNVTVVSMFPPSERIENYNHLQMDDVIRLLRPVTYLREKTKMHQYIATYNFVQSFIEQSFQDNTTKYLLRSDSKFDVLMLELYHFDGCFALAEHFDAPVIGLSYQTLVPIYNWVIGNPLKVSNVPHVYTPFTDHMNFIERLSNSLIHAFTILFYQFVSLSTYQDQADTYMKLANSGKKANIEQVVKNMSLILTESHFSAGYSQSNLPNVVEVAGIHISPPKPLPKDISDFIDAADNGVIYVSLGTLVDVSSLNEFATKLISIFQRLPYRVIWKWSSELVSNSSKILARNWLPQTDILNNPKTKLFVSHGGYHSLLESVNAGVPILCFPFFNDQHYNAAISEKYQFGMKEDLDASEEEIYQKIRELLSNAKYAENAKKQSKIFKDRPLDPLDLAVYWTEYVIRHKGAPHLRSASVHLGWYQYFLLDVVGFCSVVIVLMFYIGLRIARWVRCLLCERSVRKIKIT